MASASYNMVRSLDAKFGFLWKYLIMKEQDVEAQALTFAVDYTVDVSEELVREMLHLKTIHRENLGKNILSPMHLLNRLWEENLDGLSPNICVALRLLCTLPVSVAGAERSFSGLANLKYDFRSTMSHKLPCSLGMLYFNSTFAWQLSFDALIHDFANNKARKDCHNYVLLYIVCSVAYITVLCLARLVNCSIYLTLVMSKTMYIMNLCINLQTLIHNLFPAIHKFREVAKWARTYLSPGPGVYSRRPCC